MIVASRLVTTSRPYQPAGFRSRHTGVRSPRHDQQHGLVVDGGTGGAQGGLADPEVVTAQEQVNGVRAAGGRRYHHRDHRPCRTAARPHGNVDRHDSLQIGDELLACDGRPVRPPPLHVFTSNRPGCGARVRSLFPRGTAMGPLPGAVGRTLGRFVPGRDHFGRARHRLRAELSSHAPQDPGFDRTVGGGGRLWKTGSERRAARDRAAAWSIWPAA